MSASTIVIVLEAVLIVLFVSVCVPANVATVLSIANVTALPEPDVSIPVPPVNVNASLSKSIDNEPPLSAAKSKSCAVTCESTYALIAVSYTHLTLPTTPYV